MEVLTGTNASSDVTVAVGDSIEDRLVTLLTYLDGAPSQNPNHNPEVDYAAFIAGAEPKWSEIVMGGFSMGGANVGMIEREHAIGGAVHFDTLCSANDISAELQTQPFNDWCTDNLSLRATGGDRIFLFAHLSDYPTQDSDKEDLAGDWGLSAVPTFVNVNLEALPYSCNHLLITDEFGTGDPHHSLAKDSDMPMDGDVPVNIDAYQHLFAWLAAL